MLHTWKQKRWTLYSLQKMAVLYSNMYLTVRLVFAFSIISACDAFTGLMEIRNVILPVQHCPNIQEIITQKKKKSTSALSNCTQLWRSEITSEVTVVHTVTVLSICKVHVFFFFQSIVWDFQIYTFEHHNGQEAKTNAVLSGGVFGVVSAAYLNRNHLKTRRYIELRQGTYISYCHCRYTPTKPMKHKVTIDYFS